MSDRNLGSGFDFKAQLARAARHDALCARFEWYSVPCNDKPRGRKLLGSDLVFGTKIFAKLEETYRYADAPRLDAVPLDHAVIYVFDGRACSPKFHAHLWKPSMACDLVPLEYFDLADPNPYLPYVMDALRMQKKPKRVSTVINQAMAKVHKTKAAGLMQMLPIEAHKPLIRDTLMRLRHTDPFIYFTLSGRKNQMHIDRNSTVEHLSAYDRDPSWRNIRLNCTKQA